MTDGYWDVSRDELLEAFKKGGLREIKRCPDCDSMNMMEGDNDLRCMECGKLTNK